MRDQEQFLFEVMKAAITGLASRSPTEMPSRHRIPTPANQPKSPATSEEVAQYVAQTACRIAIAAWENYQRLNAPPPILEVGDLVPPADPQQNGHSTPKITAATALGK